MANVIAPDSLTAALTPLQASYGNLLWANHNFLVSDLTVGGLKGDGATKYLDTGLIPGAANSLLTSSSFGLAIYVTEDSAGAEEELSCYGPLNSSWCSLMSNWTQVGAFGCWRFINVNSDFIRTTSPNPAIGYFSGHRVASNLLSMYFASSTHAHTALITGTAAQSGSIESVRSLFAFAANNNGTGPANFSHKRLSFFAVTAGLSSAEDTLLFARVQALRQALGGGFI